METYAKYIQLRQKAEEGKYGKTMDMSVQPTRESQIHTDKNERGKQQQEITTSDKKLHRLGNQMRLNEILHARGNRQPS